jgi:hypothetical protein
LAAIAGRTVLGDRTLTEVGKVFGVRADRRPLAGNARHELDAVREIIRNGIRGFIEILRSTPDP